MSLNSWMEGASRVVDKVRDRWTLGALGIVAVVGVTLGALQSDTKWIGFLAIVVSISSISVIVLMVAKAAQNSNLWFKQR